MQIHINKIYQHRNRVFEKALKEIYEILLTVFPNVFDKYYDFVPRSG